MIRDIDSLYREISEHQKTLTHVIKKLQQEGNFSLESVLNNMDISELNGLVPAFENLTAIDAELNDALKTAKQRFVTITDDTQPPPTATYSTRTLKTTELIPLVFELMALYEQRTGLHNQPNVRWLSHSGNSVIHRKDNNEPPYDMPEQSPQTYYCEYTVLYCGQIVFTHKEYVWPALAYDSDTKERPIAIPQACYNELVECHKAMGSNWYRDHFPNDQQLMNFIASQDVHIEKLNDDYWTLSTPTFVAEVHTDTLSTILQSAQPIRHDNNDLYINLPDVKTLSFKTSSHHYKQLMQAISQPSPQPQLAPETNEPC